MNSPRRLHAADGPELQRALDAAQDGDEIVLQKSPINAPKYVGNFILPRHTKNVRLAVDDECALKAGRS